MLKASFERQRVTAVERPGASKTVSSALPSKLLNETLPPTLPKGRQQGKRSLVALALFEIRFDNSIVDVFEQAPVALPLALLDRLAAHE